MQDSKRLNEMHVLEQIMNSVVRIEAHLADGSKATGSGFAYNFAIQNDRTSAPTIITNKHVIEGASHISLPISTMTTDGYITGNFAVITYELNEKLVIDHPDPKVDLCAIGAAPIYEHFKTKSLSPALTTLDKSVS
ncbi:hypothetical protein [Spirulina sp. 06S082]|uniref:hypothetical protein n=1 Tax=Spirulina sp. 06S082 TaxID=3110248 RepID=UPI002B20CB1F|nr:hypothetical protein [Spirulina sp. 06S082]MEA5471301.1 hypothetical protein [Spirulina sp. 06S082]